MKKITMRFFVFLIFTSIIAKSQDIDTLLPHILALENDTEKVNQLYKYGTKLVKSNPQLAYTFAKEGENISSKIQAKKQLSEFCNLLGILFYRKGDFKKALNYHEQSFLTSKKSGDTLSMAYSMTNIANVLSDLKQYKKSEEAYLQSLNIYNRLSDQENLARCLINLGVLKQTLLQYDAAYENYKKAREIGKLINNYQIESLCLNNMAQVFADRGDYEKAIAFNYDALKIRDLMDNEEEKADSYLSLTEIFIKQKDITRAEENINLASDICKKFDYFSGKILTLKLLSEINQLKNNYQLAFLYLKQYNQTNDSLLLIESSSADDFDFNENMPVKTEFNNEKGFNNKGLLITIFILLIFIPFTLIRFKR